MNNIYIVLLKNGDIKTLPRGNVSAGASVESVTILPSEPVSSSTGRPLRELIHKAIISSAQEGFDALLAEIKRDQDRGVEADLAPPPDWLISVGVLMFQAISAGATWEIIKVAAQDFAAQFIREEGEGVKDYFEYDREKAEEAVATYLAKDFAKEKSLKELHDKLVELHHENPDEFDLNSGTEGQIDERKMVENLTAGVLADDARIREERRRQNESLAERRNSVIQSLIKHDLAESAEEDLAISVAKNIDLYLLNGIETQFLIPSLSPAVDEAIPEILSKIEIPKEVIEQFHRFQLLDESYLLTDFGRKIFKGLASLRPSSKVGPLPADIFERK